MVLHPQSIKPVPTLTRKIAQQAFPKGNLYMNLRDELGIFYNDEDFTELYSTEGQPALRPWHLALICETLRSALNALAVVVPDWLSNIVAPDWFDRYSKPVEESRLPRGTEARNDYAETIGRDGLKILEAIYEEPTTPQWLREIPAVETLRITWVHQYWIDNGQLHWRSHQDLPPAGLRSNSPYDTEARYGNKRHTTWFGYKVHLTETCEKNQVHLITNVQTTEAHLSDVDQTKSIHQSLADKELLPSEHLVDAGYVDSTLLVESKQKYDLQLIGPVRDNVSWQSKIPDGYDLSRFKINWKINKLLVLKESKVRKSGLLCSRSMGKQSN